MSARTLNSRVTVLKLTPGFNPRVFELLKPEYDAVILETYGLGGVPDYGPGAASFKQAIYDWVDSGRIAVMTTQVPKRASTSACTRSDALCRTTRASSAATT